MPYNFSAQTEPTPITSFTEFDSSHARYHRLMRRCASYVGGAALAALSLHELLLFLWIGPDYLIAIAILEGLGAYALLRPLLSLAELSTTERKTEECLNQLHSFRKPGTRSIHVVKPLPQIHSNRKPSLS